MSARPSTPVPKSALRIQFQDVLRRRHYSHRTERAYVGWIRRFARFHQGSRLEELGTGEVIAFLTDLAVTQRVSSGTQRQAQSALVFLYREVLGRDLDGLANAVRARSSRVLPTVLTREEVKSILEEMQGTQRLIATLLYGGGMRLIECLRLRVKDLDFARHQVGIRQGKGNPSSSRHLRAARQRALIESYSTPFLYALFRLVASDNYETALTIYSGFTHVSYLLAIVILCRLMCYSTMDTNNSSQAIKQKESWEPPRIYQAQAVDQAAAMVDRFNRIFLRTLRALRDLRKHSPALIVQNAGQVNVGDKQVNVMQDNSG